MTNQFDDFVERQKEAMKQLAKTERWTLPPDFVPIPDGGARKFDSDKPRWDLVPYDAQSEIVEVLTFGAKKYGDRNWELGFNWCRLIASTFRHLVAFARGEDRDPESGYRHLAHAGCNILFLLTYQIRSVGVDDRARRENSKV